MLYKEGAHNIGSGDTLQNIDTMAHIAFLLGKKLPKYEFVEDRKGHDRSIHLGYRFRKTRNNKNIDFNFLKNKSKNFILTSDIYV